MINIEKLSSVPLILHPWSHKIIDELFTASTFSILETAAVQLMPLVKNQDRMFVHPFKLESLGIDNTVYKTLIDCANMLLTAIDSTLATFPNSNKSTMGYFCLPHFAISGSQYGYKIHNDSMHRALTVLTYVAPSASIGTNIYKTKEQDSFVNQVAWKQNRTFVLTPSDSSWHSWHNTSNVSRVTVDFTCHKLESLHEVLAHMRENDKDELTEWFFKEMNNGNLIINI